MKTDLLKEAIADADAIKKLAIENAKASLNQAFDSKIKSMLAARLQEEAEEGEEEEEEKEEEANEAKRHSSEDEDSKEDSKEDAAEAEDVDEIDINKILAEMGDDEEEGEPEMEEAKHEEEEEEESEEEGEEETDEAHAEPDADNAGGKSDHDADNEETDEEVDLNALLKELEMEEGSYEEEGKEETDEAKEEEGEEDMHAKMEKMKEEHAAEIAEIKSQAAKLAGKVNETNLINAKLLYLNKILHKHNLNEAQKVKVIAAFDKATTVKEAKIVFESLNEAFVVKTEKSKTNLKESLGFASKAAGNSTKREIITEADVQVARWQKLAGINKTI